jgi:hypothetical protein
MEMIIMVTKFIFNNTCDFDCPFDLKIFTEDMVERVIPNREFWIVDVKVTTRFIIVEVELGEL